MAAVVQIEENFEFPAGQYAGEGDIGILNRSLPAEYTALAMMVNTIRRRRVRVDVHDIVSFNNQTNAMVIELNANRAIALYDIEKVEQAGIAPYPMSVELVEALNDICGPINPPNGEEEAEA